MATVKIENFGGIAPRQHPTLLADGMATVAMNVKLDNGKLVPLREPSDVEGADYFLEGKLSAAGDSKSMHVWRRGDGAFDFLCFPGMTWAARGNVADDGYTRLIVSGDITGNGTTNQPRIYLRESGRAAYVYIRRAALPWVAVYRRKSNVQQNEDDSEYGPPASGTVRYTRFVVTWVDDYGRESPISATSRHRISDGATGDEDLAYLDGESIYFELQKTEATDKKLALAKSLRIYMVVTGSSEGRFQFLAEVSKATATTNTVLHNQSPSTPTTTWYRFLLAVSEADAGEELSPVENAPVDLTCIRNVPGSFYCGFSASNPKTVCFSDIDMFYNWPIDYRYDIPDNIVALAVTSNTVFALTDGWPYALSGTAPESMTVAKLASPAACVSSRGVCVYKNAVFYASNIGMMAIANSATEGTIVQNVTDQMFTSDQWRALNPETCLLGHHKGRLYAHFPDAADAKMRGLVFNFAEGLSVALTQYDERVQCLCVDDATDKMYVTRYAGADEGEEEA